MLKKLLILLCLSFVTWLVFRPTQPHGLDNCLNCRLRVLWSQEVPDSLRIADVYEDILMEKSNFEATYYGPGSGYTNYAGEKTLLWVNNSIKSFNVLREKFDEEQQNKFPPIEYASYKKQTQLSFRTSP
jgi:hypothetical protein